jgi:hypothetical protein
MEASQHAPESQATEDVIVGNDGSQPLDAAHNPNKPGPSSAPDPRTLSGDPLDPATKQANDPNQPNPAQGEAEVPGSAGGADGDAT